MSDRPITDALGKLENIPSETLQAGVVAEGGTSKPSDVGIAIEGAKDLGKPGGWQGAASAQWWKEKGWSLAAWLGWKGK